MRSFLQEYDFPAQKIPSSQKDRKWAAECADWVIAQGQSLRDSAELERKYNILHEDIPQEYYRKILNPYNATNERYLRFPATMRNYDMMQGIIRRYISEYLKNPHDFIVSANNPEVILARNAKLKRELTAIVQKEIAAKIMESYQQYLNEGNDPAQFNPQEAVDVEKFTEEFNENYIDDISVQGQNLLNVIRDITGDTLLYARAYFEFISFGECYTYTDVSGSELVKRCVSVRDAFPVPNDSMFVEDFDMFAERRKLTYQQIIDEFDRYLTEDDRKFLDTYYAKNSVSTPAELMFDDYERFFPDICKKYNNEDRSLLKKQPIMARDTNADLYDVWHAVWRGQARRAVVTYVDQSGMVAQRVEPDDYKLNPLQGDMSIEYVYEPQVYECTRIGGRNMAVYPYGARAIAYNRDGKLPYNGVCELLPGMGKFSIVDIITPYQIFYNIVAYHREMVVAKNKLNILLLAKSLLGENPEDTLYKMIADGVLYVDDTSDSGMIRTQQIRMVSSDMGQYITQLGQLLQEIEETAKNKVDMTPQRYGEIANSAGKAVTEEGIIRGSMGSVIIEYVMDSVREHDYARDLDYSKFAWIEGLDTSYRDEEGALKYISLDVNSHMFADYVISAKNSYKQKEKLDQLKSFAFNLGQNGDAMMAIAAIKGDNVESISKLIKKYNDIAQAHEEQMKQMEQQTEQMKQQFELQKIAAKGEEDRKTKELEGYIDQQIELIRADANMISYNAEIGDANQEEGLDRLNAARERVEEEKVRLQRQKNVIDLYNAEQDRQVKMHDIDTKLKIAKENKNRYDSPKRKK